MDLIKYYGYGIATKHQKNDVFKDKKGKNAWLLMCFDTAFFYYDGKENKKGRRYECLLQKPNIPLIHGGAENGGEGFVNDWIYFNSPNMEDIIKNLEIPVNKSFYVKSFNCLTKHLSKLKNQENEPDKFFDYSSSMVIFDMLIDIAKSRNMIDVKEKNSYNLVKKVREYMVENCADKLTLDKLAKMSGYSVSRFCEIYKSIYSKSPIVDLINIRIAKAKNLILSTNMTISEIASVCGFEEVQYFSNTFKKMEGVSPKNFK